MPRSISSLRFRPKSDAFALSTNVDGMTEATVRQRGKGIEGVPASPKRAGTAMSYSSASGHTPVAASAAMYKHETRSEPRLTPKPTPGEGGAHTMSSTAKGKRKMSTLTQASAQKRSNTPAADYQQYMAEFGSPRSVRSHRPSSRMSIGNALVDDQDNDDTGSVELVDRRDVLGEDAGFDGLVNVRACCDGEHDVGALSVPRRRHHHHHSAHPGRTIASEHSTLSTATTGAPFGTSLRSNSVASRSTSSRRSKANLQGAAQGHGVPSAPFSNTTALRAGTAPTPSSSASLKVGRVPPVPPLYPNHLAGNQDWHLEPASPSLRARSSTLRRKTSTLQRQQ